MGYQWKREVPFAKIGEKVNIRKTMSDDSQWNFFHKVLSMDDDYFQQLINDGWIEEIKPREYYIKLTNGLLTSDGTADNILAFTKLRSNEKIIKVREVIDD